MALRQVQGEEREDEEKAGDESGGGTSHGGPRGARRPQAGVDLCAQEGAPSGGAGAVSCLRACVRDGVKLYSIAALPECLHLTLGKVVFNLTLI